MRNQQSIAAVGRAPKSCMQACARLPCRTPGSAVRMAQAPASPHCRASGSPTSRPRRRPRSLSRRSGAAAPMEAKACTRRTSARSARAIARPAALPPASAPRVRASRARGPGLLRCAQTLKPHASLWLADPSPQASQCPVVFAVHTRRFTGSEAPRITAAMKLPLQVIFCSMRMAMQRDMACLVPLFFRSSSWLTSLS